jgi:tetratricopeptide (TPR) repeat protein
MATLTRGALPGAELIADDPGATVRCERALSQIHTHRGDPMAEILDLLARDPPCVPAHILRAGWIVAGADVEARDALAASVAAIEAALPAAGDHARQHALAANAWLAGDPGDALERYGAIVIDEPHDLLALVVAHALDFRLGRRRMLRDRISQVLSDWNATLPGYASVLAMYAFGHEENGHYRRAEGYARAALELDPGHPGAIHALSHVMEMRGRARDGLAFLERTAPAWREGNTYAVHLTWHQALFHLDAGEIGAALELYDTRIAPAPNALASLADATALLWRLRLRDADVGSRWHSLADRWDTQSLAAARAFYVTHATMAFAAAGRAGKAVQAIETLRNGPARTPLLAAPDDLIGPLLCEAFAAFARHDYAECIEGITRVRHLSHECGGSLAQCDLIHLTLTEAALRARKARLARALAAERAAQKPASPFNRVLLQRAGGLVLAAA